MYSFDVKKAAQQCVEWVKNWFEKNGKGCNAVIGISGGKDSSVTAAVCVAALGSDRVFGVMMPNGEQFDISYSVELCKLLKIDSVTVNIKGAYDAILSSLSAVQLSNQAYVNLPARIRMCTLYAISQSKNGRVANTCNLSEDWVGYSTKYGDAAGDFSPLANFTVAEVIKLGEYLGLPDKFTQKVPIDGLCGKTDEDNLGFTYAELDKYIREGVIDEAQKKAKIDEMHKRNLFKLLPMESFKYDAEK